MSDMNVQVTRDYDFTAAAVWGVLGNFGDLSWANNPPVEVIGSGPGMIRRLTMPGMAPIGAAGNPEGFIPPIAPGMEEGIPGGYEAGAPNPAGIATAAGPAGGMLRAG